MSAYAPRSLPFPGGKKLAVSIGLAFEAFETHSQFRTESASQEINYFSLSYADYGWKAGAWRLLKLLDDFGIKSQVYTSGLAAERWPGVVAAMAEAGHEIVGHGWVNDKASGDLPYEVEQQEIRRCTAAITAASKARPVGWLSPAYCRSRNTLDLLRAEGYLWCGDDASDDLPFVETTASGSIVMMPVTGYATNDLGMWIAPRNPPGIIWDGFKDTFDLLYEEGCAGAPKWTELVLHCHMAGRPTLIPTIRKCLEYAQGHDGVWFVRRCDLAEWTLRQHAAGIA